MNNHPEWRQEHVDKNTWIKYSQYKTYLDYLKSEHWISKSNEKRKKQCRCEVCGEQEKTLIVHHKTYERIGRELLTDLQVLCIKCHYYAHQLPPGTLESVYDDSNIPDGAVWEDIPPRF